MRGQAGAGLEGWLRGREGGPSRLVYQTGATTCLSPEGLGAVN